MKNDRFVRAVAVCAALLAPLAFGACDWGSGKHEREVGGEPESHHHYNWDHGYDRPYHPPHEHERGHEGGREHHEHGGGDHDHGHGRGRAEMTLQPVESRTQTILASLQDKSSGQLFDGSR